MDRQDLADLNRAKHAIDDVLNRNDRTEEADDENIVRKDDLLEQIDKEIDQLKIIWQGQRYNMPERELTFLVNMITLLGHIRDDVDEIVFS